MSCGASIEACMGFVIARDLIAYCEGTITSRAVRELCGLCGLKVACVSDDIRSTRPDVQAKAERLYAYFFQQR